MKKFEYKGIEFSIDDEFVCCIVCYDSLIDVFELYINSLTDFVNSKTTKTFNGFCSFCSYNNLQNYRTLFQLAFYHNNMYICDPVYSHLNEDVKRLLCFQRIELFTYIKEQLLLIRPLNSN